MLQQKLLVIFLLISAACSAQEYEYNLSFFRNSPVPGSFFYSATKSSGNAMIENINKRLPVSNKVFHSAGNALKFRYKNAANGKWEATISHNAIRGQDHFKKAAFFSCWVYVETAGTKETDLPVIQFILSDSTLSPPFLIAAVAKMKWQQVKLSTAVNSSTTYGKMSSNASDIIGVIFSQPVNATAGAHTIYMDDMEFLPADAPAPVATIPKIQDAKAYAKHIDIVWNPVKDSHVHLVKIYRSLDGKKYTGIGVQQPYINRYADYTGETGKQYFYKISFVNSNFVETKHSAPVAATTKAMSDDELMTMVQEAGFRYYWEAAEPNSGLARENMHGRHNMIASGASGFGIMALLVGTEREFITRQESVERFVKIVNFLDKAETFHGAYPHFIDGLTGKVVSFFGSRDNGADLVETSFLMQGLLAARQYFSGNDAQETLIRNTIDKIWKRVEWNWFKQYPNSKFLYWHWSPDQEWVINHNLI